MPEYNCVKCGYKTSHKSSYDNHLKSRKHYQAILKCFLCDKQYQRIAAYKKHICDNIETNVESNTESVLDQKSVEYLENKIAFLKRENMYLKQEVDHLEDKLDLLEDALQEMNNPIESGWV